MTNFRFKSETYYYFQSNSLNFRPLKIKIKTGGDIVVATQTEAELALAELLIEILNLEDIEAHEIEPEEPLFGDGLGLDSIDALEIALAIAQQHNVEMKAEDEVTKQAFATLRSLSTFVEEHKT